METVHIYDEFPESAAEISDERKHEKRLKLEPLIFNILQNKYGNQLEAFWKTHVIPKISDKCVVLVERSIHPNLHFLLRNIAYFARGWSLTIVCSDLNLEYLKKIAGHNADNITFLTVFKGLSSPQHGKEAYNSLLQNEIFYTLFSAENLLFMETDSYLRKDVPNEILQYDYVAAPYKWNPSLAGGGLSFRKKSAMIHICSKTLPKIPGAQDMYICNGIKTLGYSMPPYNGYPFISESIICDSSFGIHQWWSMLCPENGIEKIMTTMLRLEIPELDSQ